jgi:hypothetical protein
MNLTNPISANQDLGPAARPFTVTVNSELEGATSYILYRKNTNFGIDLSSEDFSTWTEAETIESAGNFSSICLGEIGDQTFAVLATDGSGNYSDPVGCYCQPGGVI